jgi:hypothetical protein
MWLAFNGEILKWDFLAGSAKFANILSGLLIV